MPLRFLYKTGCICPEQNLHEKRGGKAGSPPSKKSSIVTINLGKYSSRPQLRHLNKIFLSSDKFLLLEKSDLILLVLFTKNKVTPPRRN